MQREPDRQAQAVSAASPPRLPHMWPLGFSRVDALAWVVALAVGAIGTLIAWAAGARLGAALTLGVVLVMVIVVVAMLVDARGRSFRDDN